MKKINLLMFGVLIAAAGFFGSCSKDTTNDAAISLAGDAGYTATDATVTAGGTFKVKWTATSSVNMKYISITKDDGALSAWTQVDIASASSNTYIGEATITVPASGGPYTYAIVIYDKDKVEITRKSIVITIGAVVTLTSQSTVLGDQFNSTLGSLYATSTGTVYLSTAANATNSPAMDITYGLTTASNNVPSIVSASERIAQGFTQPLATYNPTVTTYMSTSLDISTVTNADLVALSFTSATKVITVANGSTYAFKNAVGKIGIFKVTALTIGSSTVKTGSISLSIVVQP